MFDVECLRKELGGKGVTFEGGAAEGVLPAEFGGDETAVYGIGKGAEGVCCVGVNVVEGFVAEGAGGTGGSHGVEFE